MYKHTCWSCWKMTNFIYNWEVQIELRKTPFSPTGLTNILKFRISMLARVWEKYAFSCIDDRNINCYKFNEGQVDQAYKKYKFIKNTNACIFSHTFHFQNIFLKIHTHMWYILIYNIILEITIPFIHMYSYTYILSHSFINLRYDITRLPW